MSTYEQDLDELCQNVWAAHQLSSNYNAKQDIQKFIEAHKPNILVVNDEQVYSNHPELLGEIRYVNSNVFAATDMIYDLVNKEATPIMKLPGTIDDWDNSFMTGRSIQQVIKGLIGD